MAEHKKTPEEQLIGVGAFLMRQITDVKTIGEALRLLLIERGVFTDAEYLAKYEQAADLLQKDLTVKLAQAKDSVGLEILRQARIDKIH